MSATVSNHYHIELPPRQVSKISRWGGDWHDLVANTENDTQKID